MKYINRIFSMMCIGAVIVSCTDESTMPYDQDAIIATGQTTGFVRLNDVVSGEFDLNNIAGSNMEIQLEEWDAKGGALLQDIVLTVEFRDNTPDNGTNNVAATTVGTFPAAQWTAAGEDNLPNITVSTTANDALAALGLTAADLDGGDVFRFEWTLNLTNGKSFNRTNASNSLASWDFYNAPFLLDVGVVCLLPDGFATGSYAMTQTEGEVDVFFGEPTAFYEGDVDLIVGATSTERLFDFDWISFPSTMGFNLVCGKTEVSSGADPGASCGGGIVWFTGDGSGT